jgi:serine/threonine-protein kinase RsbW
VIGVRPVLRLAIPATREALEPAQARIAAHLEPLALSPRDRYRVDLLVEEVVMNSVMHAFGDSAASHHVDLALEVDADRVRLIFEDDGVTFDPTSAPMRPVAHSLAEAEPGGLGLPMLRRFADGLAWRRDGGRNHLTITLNRS